MDGYLGTDSTRIEDGSRLATTAVRGARGAIRSVDDLQELLRDRGGSDFVTPIAREAVVGDTATLALQGNKIEFSSFSNVRVSGVVAEKTYAIGIFLRSEPPNSLLNKTLASGSMVWIPPGGERDAAYVNPVEGVYIHVPADRFEGLVEERGFSGGAARFHDAAQVCLPDALANHMVAAITRARTSLLDWPADAICARAFSYAYQQLLDNFLDCAAIALDARYEAKDLSIGHAALVRRVEDLLIDHPGEIHSVGEVCDRLRVSPRTLHYAFADILGVAPRTYLRNWRLARVHADLASGCARNVAEVAMDWGFFDLGRFAGYYRQLFDELPSQTLRRMLH